MGEKPRFWIVLAILVSIAAFALIMSLWDVTEARAQTTPQCTDYKALQSTLSEKFHEQPSGAGLMGEKGQFAWTLFVSPKGETWTMVVLDAKGTACVVGGGQNWVDLSPGKGDPT